jgi:ADP-ribose pyrophosphatase YjhB (NUDIX family)
MTTHHLQQEILRQLIISPAGKRYSEIKPTDVENDLYNYHLQQLVKQQLIIKSDSSYMLTSAGKKYILDTKPLDILMGQADTFKLAAICLVLDLTNEIPHVLVQKRQLSPFAGNQELPGGSIYKGEAVTEAATRRLHQETGLSATFSLFGIIRKMRYDTKSVLYSDILYHICLATQSAGTLITENEFGSKQWVALSEYIRHEQQTVYGSPVLADHLMQLQHQGFANSAMFYSEETYTGDIY